MKTIKIYLKNCPAGPTTQIYCIKHNVNEDLLSLKEKIYRRCPNLRSFTGEPIIYWVDLENDKIRITCDDDLRFYMEESQIQKLTFEFEKIEPTRKRSFIEDDDFSEYSKRLRTKMEQIDLTDSSSMSVELSDSEDDKEEEHSEVPESVTSTTDNEPKIKIISVDIIKPADEVTQEHFKNDAIVEKPEDVTEEIHQIEDDVEELETFEEPQESKHKRNERKNSESNRIVISDSSDDDNDEDYNSNNRNRRFSDGNYNSSYSFAHASGNGDRFESRASFNDDFRNFHHHRRRRDHFNEDARRTYRNCSENMHRMFNQANSAREQAMRNFRNSANLLPDLLSTFQSHFRPLFQQNNQQNFRSRFSHQQQYRY